MTFLFVSVAVLSPKSAVFALGPSYKPIVLLLWNLIYIVVLLQKFHVAAVETHVASTFLVEGVEVVASKFWMNKLPKWEYNIKFPLFVIPAALKLEIKDINLLGRLLLYLWPQSQVFSYIFAHSFVHC